VKVELIDSHTHLDAKDFDADREAVLRRAKEAGVTTIVTIGAGYGSASAGRAVALTEQHTNVWASVGIHPHDSKTAESELETIRKLASHAKVVAIGETGLDYYRDWAPRDLQERWFRLQIALAREVKKPLVIHSRDAGADCLRLLQELGAAEVGGVFHCYAEDEHFAAELRKINFLVSFPGQVTFKKSDRLREIVRALPMEQIMVETDAPYLAPEPFRGKRCESAYVRITAEKIAETRGVTLEELASATTANARKLFRIPN
jgi:TatD DNase family protein